jgi:hypothetical protein
MKYMVLRTYCKSIRRYKKKRKKKKKKIRRPRCVRLRFIQSLTYVLSRGISVTCNTTTLLVVCD